MYDNVLFIHKPVIRRGPKTKGPIGPISIIELDPEIYTNSVLSPQFCSRCLIVYYLFKFNENNC